MPQRNPQYMSEDDIVAEIGSLRASIEADAGRIVALAQNLYARARRSSEEGSNINVMFANSWLRCAGVISQGIRRTRTVGRLFAAHKDEAREAKIAEEEARILREQAEARAARIQQAQQAAVVNDPVADLYGA